MSFKSSFLQEASDRGFIYQATNLEALDEKLASGPCTAYVGFDATADCLHVGHLLPIFFLRLFQKHGHKGIALFGGGTTKIGDPSFRNSMRPMLSEEDLAKNIQGIKECVLKFVNQGEFAHEVKFVDNSEWLDKLMYIDFLRNVGIHFTVNRMISFDSVKTRLTDGNTISFMEFNYMLMQAYDFLVLHDKYQADIQLGGQDQWGNIICGVELIRRVHGKEVFGCTIPLLTRSDGTKMGKSLSGAVWLKEEKLPAYDFWQYWRNIPDDMVGKCLRLFTDLPIEEIARLEKLQDKEINDAKIVLADCVTEITHGKNCLSDIHEAVNSLFKGGENSANAPSVKAAKDESVIDTILTSGAAASRGDAKRLLRGNGVSIDGKVVDESYKISAGDDGKKIAIGKKKLFIIKVD